MSNLHERGQGIKILSRLLHNTDIDLEHIPALIVRVVDEEMWSERVIEQTGEIVRFDSFVEFVTTPPLAGLGTTIDTLKKLCVGDKRAIDAIDRALQQSKKPSNHDTNESDESESQEENLRNTFNYELRKLRTESPDIHRRVLDGEISAYAGMIEAGFKQRRLPYYPDDPTKTAQLLLKNMSREDIQVLIQYLLNEIKNV